MPLTLLPTRVHARHDWSPGLFSLTFDRAVPLRAGQFVTVSAQPDSDRHTRRAYSVASAPGEPTELLVVEVEDGRISPLLASTAPGDTLFVSDVGRGLFTLDEVPPDKELWLIATGTGLAPYRSMLREGRLFAQHRRVILVYGVREPAHLAYLDEIQALAASCGGVLQVIALCSRAAPPPGGLPGRITERLADGALEAAAGTVFHPGHSHALLCGNPAMIDDMIAQLGARGLTRHTRRAPGHITTERYW